VSKKVKIPSQAVMYEVFRCNIISDFKRKHFLDLVLNRSGGFSRVNPGSTEILKRH